MRREDRERAALAWHRFAFGCIAFGLSSDPAGEYPVEHNIARGPCRIGKPVRPPRFWHLRHSDKQGRLGNSKPFGLVAKIGKTCGPHALDIPTIRRERKIEIENAGLARLPF